MNKWSIATVNNTFMMTRVEGDGISCRELYWWEKLRYYFAIKSYELSKPINPKDE